MSSPEIPEDQPLSMYPDVIPEYFLEDQQRAHANAFDDLNIALGRIAQVSSDTWPRSLHVVVGEEGEILVRSVIIEVGRRVGECLNITVNNAKHVGPYGVSELDIHDFVLPCAYNAVAYQSTRTLRNSNNAWDVKPDTGPILQKRHDRLEECYGHDYTLPSARRNTAHKKDTLKVVDEILAVEKLIGWLSLCNQTSYEEYISREI